MALALNPDVMRWAVERSGISEEAVCKKFKKYPEWLDLSHTPTLKQLMDFAHMVHINLCDLYANKVPDYGFQIADFRTETGRGVSNPSPELYDTIELTQRRQEWMQDYFAEEGREPIAFVGSWSSIPKTSENVMKLTKALHNYLGLDERWAFRLKRQEDAVRVMRNAVEAKGISVAINGVVGDNSHRSLSVSEFRGFVLADEIAPVIFINGQDAKGAQLFTIVHELCHLGYAKTGVVSPADPDGDGHGFDTSMERFCDSVAAEFLVSSNLIAREWNAYADIASPYERVTRIARNHKVTFMVVARQALDNDVIGQGEFFELYRQHRTAMDKLGTKPKKKSAGGDSYNTKRYRLGTVFSEAVWTALNSDAISLNDAYELANLNTKTFDEYYRRLFQ